MCVDRGRCPPRVAARQARGTRGPGPQTRLSNDEAQAEDMASDQGSVP
jgi:hypothetical protein